MKIVTAKQTIHPILIILVLISSIAKAADSSRIQKAEEQLITLDKERREAEFVLSISKDMEKIIYERIRLTGSGDSAEKKFWEMKLDYCQREAGWKVRFSKLEVDLKRTNRGLLPQWIKENREWQKLDVAMKRDTVKVSPEECKNIYQKHLKKYKKAELKDKPD